MQGAFSLASPEQKPFQQFTTELRFLYIPMGQPSEGMNVFKMFKEHESDITLLEAKQELDRIADVSESTLMNRMQVILAEKRTSLSVLRTGLGLLTLPMTIVAFLITTSNFWDPMHNLVYLIPLFTLNTILAVMGFILILRAWKRIRNFDRAIEIIKQHSKKLGHFVP